MKKYIHLGFPKNFSTSLQRSYFPLHPDLMHLGIGSIESNLGYIDSGIEKSMELYLRTCKHFKYFENEKKIKERFEKYFELAWNKEKIPGISAEHLSFSFTYDSISTFEKAHRLKNIFQNGTTIIILVRSQLELIESLFKESVRNGFGGSFQYYTELLFKYQDRNYFYDLAYSKIISLYKGLFGSENVHVRFFEDYRQNGILVEQSEMFPQLIHDLNSLLGVSQINTFSHYNQALKSNSLNSMIELNKVKKHNLGNHLLESAENHRIVKYLKEDLGFEYTESEFYSDVLIKRENIARSSDKSYKGELNMSWDPIIKNKIMKFYHEDNVKMFDELNIDLKRSYIFL